MVGPGHATCARRSSSTSSTRSRSTAASGGCATTAAPAVPATDTNIGQPAIPAIAPDFAPPRMYSETPAQLVAHFTHPNGWWRDTAQRLLVLKQDKSVVPALQQMARVVGQPARRASTRCGRSKGSARSTPALVREAMKDTSPRMRVQAIRASETLYKAGDKSFADDYRALTKDADPNVVIQAMLTLNLFKLPDAADVVKAAQAANKAQGVALIGERLLAPRADRLRRRRRRGGPLTPDEEKRLQQGSDVFGAVCFACHGADGRAQPLAGAPAGHDDGAAAGRIAARAGASRLRDQGAAERADRSARRQDLSAKSWCRWAATRRVDRRHRVVRPQQLRQQRRAW